MAELFDSLAGRTRFTHFCAVFNCVCSRSEAPVLCTAKFVRPVSQTGAWNYRYPRLNRSQEIPPEAIGAAFSTVFRDNF